MTNNENMTAEQIAAHLKRLQDEVFSWGISAALAGCGGGGRAYYEKREKRAERELAAFKKSHGLA
jgi:hypothetical protein